MSAVTTRRRWTAQEAAARFDELLARCLEEGPQVVTREGTEVAVVVPVAEWRLQEAARPTLKELLLAETPRGEIPSPSRTRWRRRPFEGPG